MKNVIISVFAAFMPIFLTAQDVWTLDPGHSKIGFTVTHHMISEVDGFFRDFEAKMTVNAEDYSDAIFEFTTQTKSINTEHEQRDNHLKSADIFDAEQFPTITFKSTSFTQIAGEHYTITGDLTIKGKTLPLSLDMWLVGPVTNDRAKRWELGAKAIGSINRKDFGVGENLGTTSVSNQVDLRVIGEFNRSYE